MLARYSAIFQLDNLCLGTTIVGIHIQQLFGGNAPRTIDKGVYHDWTGANVATYLIRHIGGIVLAGRFQYLCDFPVPQVILFHRHYGRKHLARPGIDEFQFQFVGKFDKRCPLEQVRGGRRSTMLGMFLVMRGESRIMSSAIRIARVVASTSTAGSAAVALSSCFAAQRAKSMGAFPYVSRT
jgi:hypothetical protein